MAKNFRVAVIGRTGGGDYGHGVDAVWKLVPNVDVVAVADADEQGRAAAMSRSGAKTGYADYRQMLEKERPDVVAVAERWIDRHHELILACAEHGCHVYMEKPFVRTLAEADDVVTACEMRHLKLGIAHVNRYSPPLDVVRKLIQDGEIGEVLELRARGKEDQRGGAEDLWVLGTHMLDVMRFLQGDVVSCYATVMEQGNPVTKANVRDGNEGIGPLAGDRVDATYRFKNGPTGFFSSHRGKGGNPARFAVQVFGTKGVIEWQSGYGKPAFLLRDSSWSPGRSGQKWVPVTSAGIDQPEKEIDTSHGGNLPAVLNLLDAIEHDRQPKSNMYDARAATEMIVAVFESHRLGAPVTLPLKNRQNPLTMLKS